MRLRFDFEFNLIWFDAHLHLFIDLDLAFKNQIWCIFPIFLCLSLSVPRPFESDNNSFNRGHQEYQYTESGTIGVLNQFSEEVETNIHAIITDNDVEEKIKYSLPMLVGCSIDVLLISSKRTVCFHYYAGHCDWDWSCCGELMKRFSPIWNLFWIVWSSFEKFRTHVKAECGHWTVLIR